MPKTQVAVLAVSTNKPGKILLITSRNSKSWSLAKGNADRSMSLIEAARREAFEEAGVIGRMRAEPIGNFTHHKSGGGTFRVKVFKMHVQRELSKWPEQKERRRRWVSVEATLKLVTNPSLGRLIRMHFYPAPK